MALLSCGCTGWEATFPYSLVWQLAESIKVTPRELASDLIAVYCLTGCDSVSFQYGKGKKRAFKIALSLIEGNHIPLLISFAEPGTAISNPLFDEARLVITTLYGKQHFHCLDELREHMFSSSKSDLKAMPPTEDAFKLHIKHALYTVILYKNASQANLVLDDATLYGRQVLEGNLVAVPMTKNPKPVTKRFM